VAGIAAGAAVTRRRRLVGQLYRLARGSNNVRAAGRGPGAYARRVVRRRTYAQASGATGRLLRLFRAR
jgi:hypothetical protein